MSVGRPEIHLFVIWEHGRTAAERIVADLRSRFTVVDAVEVEWRRSDFPRHLTRFYGQSLPPGSDKERHCGTGPFLLIVVEDEEPEHGLREAWGTPKMVNTRVFDAKQRYRDWTGGGHRIHSTIDAAEADHDLFFILGARTSDYAERARAPAWDGTFRRHVGAPVGSEGWNTLAELLTAVEVTLAYVRLPDHEGEDRLRLLVEGHWPHWGVEWLVAAADERAEDEPLYPVVVSGRRVPLELRYVGDGYHDPEWQRAMLRDRVRGADDAFVLSPPHEFYVRLYESLAHGRGSSPPAGREALEAFLSEHRYRFRPEAAAEEGTSRRLRTAVEAVARAGRHYVRRRPSSSDS